MSACVSNETINKIPNLIAYRKAPLGSVTLKTYPDSTFEFIASNLRTQNIYKGTYKLSTDTLYFRYTDSIPRLNSFKAIISDKYVAYIDGTYPEKVDIKLNELRK